MEAPNINMRDIGPNEQDLTQLTSFSFVETEILPYFFSAISLLKDRILEDPTARLTTSKALREELQYLSTSAPALKQPINPETFAFLQRFIQMARDIGPRFDPRVYAEKQREAGYQGDSHEMLYGADPPALSIVEIGDLQYRQWQASEFEWEDIIKEINKTWKRTRVSRTKRRDKSKCTPNGPPAPQNVRPSKLPQLQDWLENLNEETTTDLFFHGEIRTIDDLYDYDDYYSSEDWEEFNAVREAEFWDASDRGEMGGSPDYEPEVARGASQTVTGREPVYPGQGAAALPARRLGRLESAVVVDQYGNTYLARPRV
ncbi:Hypothetical protein D9617_11g007790 [Elsinoe fawcettii]|nr:Hypothetical protein D9617_11g007790 [Elsinoe fawcettii]